MYVLPVLYMIIVLYFVFDCADSVIGFLYLLSSTLKIKKYRTEFSWIQRTELLFVHSALWKYLNGSREIYQVLYDKYFQI
jgi:hypothetical protein